MLVMVGLDEDGKMLGPRTIATVVCPVIEVEQIVKEFLGN